MKKKISNVLAASLIASQMQVVTFAENVTDINSADINKENISQDNETINANTNIEEDVEDKESIEDLVEDKESTEDDSIREDSINEENTNKNNYKLNGKLELDLNFSMPIKYSTADKTNISVTIKNKNGLDERIQLGSEVSSNTTASGIKYTIEALNSKRDVLNGKQGGPRTAVLMNAGAGLYIGGKAETLKEGIDLAAKLIDDKSALRQLEAFIRESNQ